MVILETSLFQAVELYCISSSVQSLYVHILYITKEIISLPSMVWKIFKYLTTYNSKAHILLHLQFVYAVH